jgi:hypothetical protein
VELCTVVFNCSGVYEHSIANEDDTSVDNAVKLDRYEGQEKDWASFRALAEVVLRNWIAVNQCARLEQVLPATGLQ